MRYDWAEGVLLRVPLLPVDWFLRWSAEPESTITDFLAQTTVRNAIRISSPQLHSALLEVSFRPTGAVLHAVEKLLVRMSTRPVPFGAYAGVAAASYSGAHAASLSAAPEDWCCTIFSNEPVPARQFGRYVANPTAYIDGNAILYKRPSTSEPRETSFTVFVTSSIAASSELRQLLLCAKTPVSIDQLDESLRAIALDAVRDGLLMSVSTAPPSETHIINSCHRDSSGDHAVLHTTTASSFPETVARQCVRAVKLLRKLGFGLPGTSLKNAARAFEERFDDARVPLLAAIEEIAWCLSEEPTRPTLPVPTAQAVQALYAQAVQGAAISVSANEIEDHVRLDSVLQPTLSETLSVLGRLLPDAGVFVEHIQTGPSARLMGRFVDANDLVRQMVRNLGEREQDLAAPDLLAEVVNLEDARLSRIIGRAGSRFCEIPLWNGYNESDSCKIVPADLFLEVANGVFRLTTVDGQRIRPRNTSAHMYSNSALALYQFLSMLADSEGDGVGWHWGELANAPFLPRVTLDKGIVLSRARWRLGANNMGYVAPALPRFVSAFDADDNELVFDLESSHGSRLFHQRIESGPVVVTEALPLAGNIDAPGGRRYLSQFVLPLVATPKQVSDSEPAGGRIRRVLHISDKAHPGSNWFYAKVYLGSAAQDSLLLYNVAPLMDSLWLDGIIDKWYFVRYARPRHHLRLRLYITDVAMWSLVCDAIRAMVQECDISDFELCTYYREVYRYGNHRMGVTEDVFGLHSTLAIRTIASVPQPKARRDAALVSILGTCRAAVGSNALGDTQLMLEKLSQISGSVVSNEERSSAGRESSAIHRALRDAHSNDVGNSDWSLHRSLEPAVGRAIWKWENELRRLRFDRIVACDVSHLRDIIHLSMNRMLPFCTLEHEHALIDALRRLVTTRGFKQSRVPQ